MSSSLTSRLCSSAVFALLLLSTTSLVSAQTCPGGTGFTSTLNNPNDSLAAGAPGVTSFGTVCVSLTGTTATITYLAASGYSFVDGSSVAANVAGTFNFLGYTTNSASGILTFTTSPPPVDGRGDFTAILDAPNSGPDNRATNISMTVQETGSTNWGTAAGVLTPNNFGNDAAAHIFINSSGVTGYVGELPTTTTVMPEPTSVALFGGVLLFTGLKLRKRFV